MRQAIQDFLSLHSSLGDTGATMKAYTERIRAFQRFLLRKKVRAVRDITIRHVRAYHDALRKRNLDVNSRAAYLGTIRRFLRWAYENNLMLADLGKRMEVPLPRNGLPPTPLTHEDVRELFEVASRTRITGKRNRAIVEVLYATGIRRVELAGLNIGDLDAEAETLFVRGKGQKDRVVPIHPAAIEAVNAFLASQNVKQTKNTPLFASALARDKTRRVSLISINQLFQRLSERFHKHVYPHLLRHTFACHMLQGGADIRYVQELLGHDNTETTGRYLGLVKEDLKREYDRAMQEILAGLGDART
jgi:integrase/recombinase XerC